MLLLLGNESVDLTDDACLVLVVYEVASLAVATESRRVEGLAQLRLVLRMTVDGLQVLFPVGELTPVAVPAEAALFERTTQLRLVSAAAVGLRRVRQLTMEKPFLRRASVSLYCLAAADPDLLRRPEALISLAA